MQASAVGLQPVTRFDTVIAMDTRHTTARLQRFGPNPAGRDYAVGDVHGCFGLLASLLTHIGFDRAHDRLFSIGDLTDRGPQSERVCAWLEQPWFHAIRGNHEAMMLDAVRITAGRPDPGPAEGLWRANGGDWFFDLPAEAQIEIRQAIAALPWAIEVTLDDDRTAVLVHADVLDDSWPATRALLDDDTPAPRLLDELAHLVWSRTRATDAARALINGAGAVSVAGVDLIFFGHTPMRWPLAVGNTRWLDTGAVYGGSLSVAELAVDGQVWSMSDTASTPVTGWRSRV